MTGASGSPGGRGDRLCICGADADALTDEAHAVGCPERPSLRTSLGLDPALRASMGPGELLAFVDAEGLDLLVHSPRSRVAPEWTVAAYDFDEPRLAGIGSAKSFAAALYEALSCFRRCVLATVQDAGHGSTLPPPLPELGDG